MDLEVLRAGIEPDGRSRPRVAVDAMGGDHAPEEVVAGAVDWARAHPDTDVILVGDEARIAALHRRPLPANVSIVQACEIGGAWTSTPRPPCGASATRASTSACAWSRRARPTRS